MALYKNSHCSSVSSIGENLVFFAYLFLLLGQIEYIYKIKQVGFRGNYLRGKNFTLSFVVFRAMIFDPPLYFMGEALRILYYQTFCWGLEYL